MNQCYFTSKLPPELTDTVIDYLHDDTPALSACSTVSSSWLPAARYHLFNNMRVADLLPEGEFKDFRAFLRSSRAPLSRVCRLQLTGCDPSGISSPMVQVDIGMLTSILDNMRNLRCLELDEVCICPVEASRHSFKLARLVITDLRVSSVDCFLEIFKLFSEVRELQIVCPNIEVQSDSLDLLPSLVPVPHKLKVESFCLRDPRQAGPLLFKIFHRLLSMESLRSIETVWESPEAMDAFGALVRDAGPNVHNLTFNIYEPTGRNSRALCLLWYIYSMRQFTSLRSLRIGICHCNYGAIYAFFERALNVIPQTPRTLESLTLEFSSLYCIQGVKELMIAMLDELHWETLDAHCGAERHMLQSVTIIFNHLGDCDTSPRDAQLSMNDVVTYFHSKLPILSRKGVLKFDSDV